MANVKITALTAITPAAADVLPVVDISANSGAGITSKTTVANIPKNASNGTAATPSHSFAGDPDTGMWRRAADTLAFSTGAAQIVEINSSGDLLIGGTLPSAPKITLASDGTATIITDSGNASNVVLGENNRNPFIQLNRLTGTGAFYNHKIEGGVADLNFHVATSTTSTSKLVINSSGNIKLGTDVSSNATTGIYINGSNGSAEFSGRIDGRRDDSTDYSPTTNATSGSSFAAINTNQAANHSASIAFSVGTSGNSSGKLNLISETGGTAAAFAFQQRGATSATKETFRIASSGNVLIGGTLPASPAISLNNNGSSTFQGELTVNRATGSPSALVIRENNVEKIKFKPTGQAFFSGPVSIGGNDADHTIEEYEEGVFSPSLTFLTSGSVNALTRQGYYTIVGSLVTINLFINTSSISSPVGNAVIGELPANLQTTGNFPQFFGLGKIGDSNFNGSAASGNKGIFVLGSGSSSFAAGASTKLLIYKDADFSSPLQGSDFVNGNNKNLIRLSLTYRTN